MVGVIVIIITLVFIFSAKFLSLNINKALVVDEKSAESKIVEIDLDSYYAVAKKAGIDLSANISPSSPNPLPSASASTTMKAPSTDTRVR